MLVTQLRLGMLSYQPQPPEPGGVLPRQAIADTMFNLLPAGM
jgi:hypothetical protein